MNKREQRRKMGECTCSNCGILFKKPQSEINRNLKIGRRNFCTRSCSGIGNIKNFGEQKNNYDISKHSDNSRDEFTPFRYHFRNCKKRYRDFDIDLQYLKELWEQQQGICPFSGVKLVLNAYTNIFKVDCNPNVGSFGLYILLGVKISVLLMKFFHSVRCALFKNGLVVILL